MEQTLIETEKFKVAIEKPPGTCLPLNMMNSQIDLKIDPQNSHQTFVRNGQIHINPESAQQMMMGNCNTQTILDPQQLMIGNVGRESNMQDLSGSGSVTVARNNTEAMRQVIGSGISDDDFFHLTCHIEPTSKKKIENGEYVDLDKLLPKENTFHGRQVSSNETKLECIQSEGSTYLVPAKTSSRVNCFRRWEQAFRMYATIYCTQNPNRAREIWHYISVINTASLSYNWDNVYNYDIVFRQLMEFNPSRSWAVTYNQMWNLSMTNPIDNQGGRRNFGNTTSGQQSFLNNGQKRKLDYCWSFNKAVKCRFSKKCKFIERCLYCDDPSHGVNNCHKLDKKERDGKSLPGNNNNGGKRGKLC